MLQSEKYDIDRIFRLIVSLVTLCLLFALIYYLRTVLIPFAIAFVIANFLNPVVDYFERIKIPRIISILIVFFIIAGILFLLFFFGVPYVIDELSQFSQIFPDYISNIYEFIVDKLGEDATQNIDQYIENLQSAQFIDTLINYLTNIFSQLLNLIYLLVGSVIVVMYVFFILRDINRIRARWLKYIPEKYRETIQMFVKDTYYYTVTFFRGQLTVVTILGILFAVGFSIVNIRLAILIGFTAGFLNLIPNFGTLVAIIPAVLLAIGRAVEVDRNPLLFIAGVLIVFLVVQLLQDMVIVPKIMGKRTGLRPATLLISVFIWGKLLGFLGVILAIPLTCLTKVYFARFILKEEPVSLAVDKKE